MEASNINVMLAVTCLVAGTGIGALGYHLLNSGARSAQRLRLKLTERERQLSEWKSGVDDHLQQMSDKVERLVEDSQSLQQQLEESVRQLGSNVVATGMQTPTTPVPQDAETEDGVSAPRDYADGNRGTLSEDFGLRQQREEQQEQPAPPRY